MYCGRPPASWQPRCWWRKVPMFGAHYDRHRQLDRQALPRDAHKTFIIMTLIILTTLITITDNVICDLSVPCGKSGTQRWLTARAHLEEVLIDMQAWPITDRTPGTALLEKKTCGDFKCDLTFAQRSTKKKTYWRTEQTHGCKYKNKPDNKPANENRFLCFFKTLALFRTSRTVT